MDEKIVLIKKQILEELGYLSYMEKKKIRDDHDSNYIDKELERIRSQKKSQLIIAICWIIFTTASIFLFIFDTKQVLTNKDIVFRAIVTICYFSLSLSYVYSLADTRKRESLYRILSVFNKQIKEAV